MFTRDVLAPDAIAEFYVEGYHDARHAAGQRVNASINIDVLNSLGVDVAGKAVLDIGAGFGSLLARLRDRGAQRALGVELSRAQRRYASETLGLDIAADLAELRDSDRFDVITLFEVIEHLPEPAAFIRSILPLLKPGGSLIVGTDNFESDAVETLGAGFPKWIPHEHVSFFSPKTLTMMLTDDTGLEIVGTSSFTTWELLARTLVFRLTSGRRGAATYDYDAIQTQDGQRQYRLFTLRLALNRLWFRLARRTDLGGAMMYLHVRKM
ncbi:class I SAM-dependent methyltransferase [Bradyrhizobium sp. HKCCYLS3077]|uniref:class I SAM-dependent methyltransferase n=1 Tax=Bradyrhizobium sp. HKCCYLS3077 TaxID=3420761 RepID=UPI003EBC5A24